jgi:hypothetical protein
MILFAIILAAILVAFAIKAAAKQAYRLEGKRKRAIPLKTSATQGDVRGFDEGRDAVAYLKPHFLH